MKPIKLLLIFSLILGGIVAAFYFATRPEPITIIELPETSLQQYREQFETDWRTTGDWNEDTFKSHCDLINQLSAQNYDVVSLNDLNTSTAVEVVYEHIISEWKNPSCKKQVIDNYMRAIAIIEKSEDNASSNPNVKLIKEVNNVYARAYELAHRNFGLTPKFDGYSWNSYSNYASSIESQKSAILGNSYYKKYLSNISEISNGVQGISSRLSSGRTTFYKTLAEKIRAYYGRKSKSERTRSDLNSLRNVISKYENEYGKNSSLSSFAHSYANDVYENENSNY